jgi:hypothetical protein
LQKFKIMKNLTILLCVLCLSFTSAIHAQSDQPATSNQPSTIEKTSIGFGVGQDFGGYGANFTYYPIKNLGVFGGGGWAMAGFGYNVGLKFRFSTDLENARSYGYLLGMYGYNATITIANQSIDNRIFYGPSAGIGINSRFSTSSRISISIAVIYPFRSKEVDNYTNDLKKNHGVVFQNNLLPVTFSLGLVFPFDRK